MPTATIRDVARYAGVGVGTVSRVLNDSPDVSDATRDKVLSAIAELNFAPNPIARRLSLGKTLTIAVIAPFFTRPAVVERLRGIEAVLADSEYDLTVYNIETEPRRDAFFRNVPRRERVDGLIIISLLPRKADVLRLHEAGAPVVLIDVHSPEFNRVVVDDVAGGRRATEHLLSLGHRRIGFLSDYADATFHFTANKDRLAGYRVALERFGLPVRSAYCVHAEHSRASAYEAAYELLTLPEPPTAVFAANDTLAIGVLEAADEMDLSVPEDLSVIGYDDIEISEYLHLTTVKQSLYESGIRGGQLLLDTMVSPPETPRKIVLPTELLVRDTTGPPSD